MIKDGKGGSNTKVGLIFERRVDIKSLLEKIDGYKIEATSKYKNITIKQKLKDKIYSIFYNNKLIAYTFQKYAFYTFLEANNIDYTTILSKRLLPDDALLIIIRDTLFIIEIKFQSGAGSVDEKLQTCDFKKNNIKNWLKKLV